MGMERLQKVLAQAGVASRRAVEKMILEGRVEVNGTVAELGMKVGPEDHITVDGKAIRRREGLVYIVLNKPAGYITTARDTHSRQTVMELLKDMPIRVYPVGRLDKDTEGLLLLTNDGELANRLMHPSSHVPKTYLVVVEGVLTQENIRALEQGVELYDGKTLPAKVENVERTSRQTSFLLTIVEGRNRQIRRMCGSLGRKVTYLKRLSIGGLTLGDLALGAYRHLTSVELESLRLATKGDHEWTVTF